MATPFPTLFLGHGSPTNALDDNGDSRTWRDLGRRLPRPRAILAVSAHWEHAGPALTVSPRPATLHDFYGFPEDLATFDYPVPGDPALVARVADLLAPGPVAADGARGLDHGVWSLLAHLYPDADVPVIQLALDRTRAAAGHYELARRLRPLRDEEVLILASGNVVHDLRHMDWRRPDGGFDWAARFSAEVRTRLAAADHAALVDYLDLGPEAIRAVPTPEHYLPLLYVAAVADPGETPVFVNDHLSYGSIGMLGAVYGLDRA
ncbi:4,5-DOPA dioxygenase extradiol [Parasulfuritortus cantonensis]|uniref:4,5-DOPA dioxygenase extradiol n=1 Tax=Parasulfuritortus cantonensis TaxID=2528202 RepID=A0A4R1BGT3_9PROT|nr:4,5-DOPA dioxygenase extradiol [Parasulfuritortus cantonensis]TCJ16374.1 4,5-DOPA dioxygenase extradiol [Parasulfuritortus cantonensis]